LDEEWLQQSTTAITVGINCSTVVVWTVRRSNIYEKQSNECVIEKWSKIWFFL